MKTKAIKIFNLIFAVLVAFFVTGYAFAWFAEDKKVSLGFGGSSAGAYFASGTGTSTDPFILNDKLHLYNLAWLQNTGRLVNSKNEQTKYYFEIDKNLSGNLDMSGYVLPPIGNDEYPFIGEFNGNGKIISNLTVSTNKKVLTNSPLQSTDSYKFSNAVGMFGKTGTGSNVTNFILNNPVVEVADETSANVNTSYSTSSTADPKAVGLAFGYIENKASSIGIIGGVLSVQRAGYKTVNSIIGAMSDNAEGSNNITGDGSGADTGNDTGLFVPQDIYKRIVNSNEDANIRNLTRGTVPSSSDSTSTLYFKTDAWIVPKSNSGESGLNLGSFSISFDNGTDNRIQVAGGGNISKTSLINFYSRKGAGQSYLSTDEPITVDLTSTEYAAGSESAYAQSQLVGFDGKKITELTHRFYFAGGKDAPPYNYTNGVYYEDGSPYTLSDSTQLNGKLNVYTNSIKINVVTDNAKVFVVAEANTSDNRTLAVYKIDDIDYSKPENFACDSLNNSTNKESVSTEYMTMYVGGTDPKGTADTKNLYACEFDLSKTETGGGKGSYLIASVSSGIGIYYMSVYGVSGGNSSSGSADSTKLVSSIDFIYGDVTITQEAIGTEGNEGYISAFSFVVNDALYTETGVRVYFSELSAALYIGFIRKSETNYPLYSEYYGTDTISVSVTGKANVSSNENISVSVSSSGASVSGFTWSATTS